MKSKIIFYFLICILLGCTKFTEDLNEDFISFKQAKISTFKTDFPLINIKVNQPEFDEMFLNYTEDIEIEGLLNLYRNSQQIIFDELVEIEIKGTQSATFSLKSLGIKFDDTFDNSNGVLLSPKTILPNHSLKKIKAFRLRNSGNDFQQTLIKDISYTQLALSSGLDLDFTYYEPTLVFVNNSFLGIMNLRTEGNTNGISRLNDVKKNAITLAKINFPGEIEKKDGDFERIEKLLKAIEEQNVSFLKENIDINNFIDYLIFQSYIANVDWPYNNVRFYAVNESKFRFVVYDLDWANTRKKERHPLDFIRNPTKYSPNEGMKNPITDLFNVLYTDPIFKSQFNNRYIDIINSNVLSSKYFNNIVDANFDAIKEYMPLHIEKYSDIGAVIEWYRNIEYLKESFKKREDNILKISPLF
jgi:hypothetical protein